MHLVQILLPLRDRRDRPFPPATFARVREELAERFGGVTAYLQAPAQGVWKDEDEGKLERDQVVVVEVMVDSLDRAWWKGYCEELRGRFEQDELAARAIAIERL